MKRKERKKPSKNVGIRSKELEARGVSMDMETSWAAPQLTPSYSNLNDMARFQQKQLQEKEQKLLQLYDQQQQRAYQVMQRGSAGSNGSNYGSSVSQHTVTKTTSSSHTTSTSQGGRVRQMFDERRHTTVKGIDRSYPLEPLENKPRKQTNGNAVQKNGNSTVNRHSVTVRRVARADMNSNLNGGKPIVSYHEDITRESFGPSGRQQPDDDDEVGNENHVVQFANGNHRDETHIEEVLDEDTIERNRMMAKLHLMEYDETLKHRIKNDLESEEFPEDFMVDVPDRLPKQSVPKKLSQAEARLERFRNANAKRNNATKNTSTIGVSRKRSDPIFPAKSTSSRRSRMMLQLYLALPRTCRIISSQFIYYLQSKNKISKGSSIAKNGFENNESKDASVTPKYLDETQSTSESESTIKRRNYSPQFFSAESKKLATVSAINSKITGRSTPDFSKDPRSRSQSPKFFCKESEKSATTYAIDPKTYGKLSPEGLKNKQRRSESPKFFCKESKKSATTYAIDSKMLGKLSPEELKNRHRRSQNPKFFCTGAEKSTTTYTIDSKPAGRLSPDFSENKRLRSESPKFFCKESEKSATTYAIDKKTCGKLSPEELKNKQRRSESPKFFCKDSQINKKLYPEVSKNQQRTVVKIEPKCENVRRKSGKSLVIMDRTVDKYIKSPGPDKINRISSSPENPKNDIITRRKIENTVDVKPIRNGSTNLFERLTRERSASPQFIREESRTSMATTGMCTKECNIMSKPSDMIDKIAKKRSYSPEIMSPKQDSSSTHTTALKSPDFAKKILRKSTASPQFFSDRSATIMFVTPETITKTRTGSKYSIRNSVSRYFSEQCEKASESMDFSAKNDFQKTRTSRSLDQSRSITPEFYCHETGKSATTVSLRPKTSKDSNERLGTTVSKKIESRNKSSKSPNTLILSKDATVICGSDRSTRHLSPNQQKLMNSRSKSPEFFCYETDKSATAVSLKPKHSQDFTERSKSPRATSVRSKSRSSKSSDIFTATKNIHISSEKLATTVSLKPKPMKDSLKERSKSPRSSKFHSKNRSSKSPEFLIKDPKGTVRRVSSNVLRSTRLIRDVIRHQKNNQCNGASWKDMTPTGDVEGTSSVRGGELKTRSKLDEAGTPRANRNVHERATTPSPRRYELLAPESSPKSSTSVDVDAEIQEITMPDQNVKQKNLHRELRSTYTKSVVKSPSPDSTKATETSNRVRRNVRSSLSKSPDTVTRRPSTDLKALDTKSTKRPTPTKGTEPIANRKTATTTTTTTTRKSTDVVDGAILENGLHLRDQTAETKYDNDSQTTKKSDAFVIEFDEQAPKETDGPLPRKPLFKRPSTEKQAPSTQAGRPPSSVSSTSSGSSMQANISGSKSKMASKTRASNFSTSSRASALPKTGNACASDLLVPCKMCGRRFAQDRVILHEQICAKTAQKKRKQFDSVMFRVKGTELEKFVKKGVCKKQTEKPPEVKSNWRRKHEDFINAIRSAKQVQAHLAAGGKLSDLPPPPASDTSDYIQCPHCGRKFNKAAADRHIPKCEHMLHNKPIHSRAPKPRR
ncbi:Zinc finger C2HC domain-containing protein 1C [Dufourea novaeangliae]|uniref:Zinc finger C2HC domain-containing protein 1C n=1 Tax=Dufourea novaeangliae TaxID=178035 RepID=A0A154P648_DUFNO|nr:Zinc finger C2HC domain-containing protein 1C [Dufourea novaeangliae]